MRVHVGENDTAKSSVMRLENSPDTLVCLTETSSPVLNLATVGVGLDLGLPKVAATLERFGLPQPPMQVQPLQ